MAWEGKNHYLFILEGGDFMLSQNGEYLQALYILYYPFTLLSWEFAKILWIIINIFFVFFLPIFIGKKFDAIISGVTEWGIYAEIVKTLCEGLIKISSMKDDHYIFDSEKMRITGRNSEKIFRLGQPIRVLVIDTDIEKRTIDLELT